MRWWFFGLRLVVATPPIRPSANGRIGAKKRKYERNILNINQMIKKLSFLLCLLSLIK